METVEINTQWPDKFMSTSQQEVETATEVSARELKRSARAVSPISSEDEFTSDSSDDDDDDVDYNALSQEELILVLELEKDYETRLKENDEYKFEERQTRIKHMQFLFGTHPELEKIAKDWDNRFVDSNLTKYLFTNATRDRRKTSLEDLKCIVNLCGSSLTTLNIYKYCSSSIMPLIKSNCSNIKELILHFHTIEDQDFENCFSNMPKLKVLMIRLKCENLTIPMTLAKSLEQVCETLKTFSIQDELCSPDSSVSVISSSTEALMTVIANMKNIKQLTVNLDPHGITDEFLINLVKNAKKINHLSLRGTYITDAGIIALNNAEQLKYFSIDLFNEKSANKLITDQSLKCLSNEKLIHLTFSHCVNVTNKGVIAIAKKLPNLRSLFVGNTKVTDEIRKEIEELKTSGKTNIFVLPLCDKWL